MTDDSDNGSNDLHIDLDLGPCQEKLRQYDDNTFDALITDPPYGLGDSDIDMDELLRAWAEGQDQDGQSAGFMSAAWDQIPPPHIWEEVLRVLKPGRHGAVFAGTRTWDLMKMSLQLAGFEVDDMWRWQYGCMPPDTDVYTTDGWMSMKQARDRDVSLLTYDHEEHTFAFGDVDEWSVYDDYDDEMFQVGHGSMAHPVSVNHRIFHFDGTSNPPQTILPAEHLYDKRASIRLPKVDIREDDPTLSSIKVQSPMRVTRSSYDGPVMCPSVETGLFVARYDGGDAFVTGNSGFPKNFNVRKHLDKKIEARYGSKEARCECDVDGDPEWNKEGEPDPDRERKREIIPDHYDDHDLVTRVCSWCLKPYGPFLDELDSKGTALKPSWEAILIVRKPEEPRDDRNELLESYGLDLDTIGEE